MKMVTEQNCSVYKASKECGVPWSTLKDHLSRHLSGDKELGSVTATDIPKLGRPFVLSSDFELKLFKYIIRMQELQETVRNGFNVSPVQDGIMKFVLMSLNVVVSSVRIVVQMWNRTRKIHERQK